MMRIRLATTDDAAAVAEIYRPAVEATAISFEEEPPSPEEMAQRIATIGAHYPWLVLDGDDGIAGYAYASRHRDRAAYRWSVDTTVYVSDAQRRRGVGRALYEMLFRLLREQGYFTAYAGITLPNPASVGLHQAIGFSPIGTYRHVGYKLGAWHDVAWFAAVVQPPVSNPAEPRAISIVAETVLGRRNTL